MTTLNHPPDVNELIEQVRANTDHATIRRITRNIWPTLQYAGAVDHYYYEHHSIKRLVDYLLELYHRVEEFKYFVGPLTCDVFTENEYVADYYNVEGLEGLFFRCPIYLVLATVEVLALKNPILEGPWEQVAWMITMISNKFCNDIKVYNKGRLSRCISKWIIQVMGDVDLCPNLYLKLEFFNMFGNFVKVNDINHVKAFEACMLTCSALSLWHVKEFLYKRASKDTSSILCSIIFAFDKFSTTFLKTFDQQLSKKLISAMRAELYDPSCPHLCDTNKTPGNFEMKVITGLLQVISGYTLLELKAPRVDLINPDHNFYKIAQALKGILRIFKNSCQTPQLVYETASCVIGIMELAFQNNYDALLVGDMLIYKSMYSTNEVLEELCDDTSINDIIITPVGRSMENNFTGRLTDLRYLLKTLHQKGPLDLNCYTKICSVLYHCKIDI